MFQLLLLLPLLLFGTSDEAKEDPSAEDEAGGMIIYDG